MAFSCSIGHRWDSTPLKEIDFVHVDIQRNPAGLQVLFQAPFYNDPAPQSSACSLWGLWEYEVFEIFFVGEDGQYLEAEFGPHGHHLVLWLDSPRNIVKKHLPISFSYSIQEKRWFGAIQFNQEILPKKITHWNIFSIHGTDKRRQYNTMKPLKTEQPDFHQPKQFPLFPEALCSQY